MAHFLYFANIQSLLKEPLNENNRILIFIFNELYELHKVISILYSSVEWCVKKLAICAQICFMVLICSLDHTN